MTTRDRFQIATVITFFAFVVYVAVFIGLVRENTSRECTLVWVDFPKGSSRTIFRPLIETHKLWDENVLYAGETDETRRDFCGE